MVQAPSRLAPTQQSRRARRSAAGWCCRRWPTPASISAGARARDRARRGRSRRQSKVPTGTYFADWVAPAAQQAFDADFGEVKVRDDARRDLQRLAVRAVGRAPIGDAQAALVAMRPDGRVVAMVGGKNYAEVAVQPRHPGAAPAGLGVQAVRLSRRAARRLDARQHDRGPADHHRRLDPGQQRRRLSRPDHAARGVRPVEQRGDRAAVASRSAATMSSAPRATSASPRRCPTSRAWRSAPPASACSS